MKHSNVILLVLLGLFTVVQPLSSFLLFAQTGGAVWEEGPLMNQTRIYPFVARLDDGRQIALGGREYGFYSSWYADAYNPETNAFTSYIMQAPLDAGVAVALSNGKFLLSGGGDDWGIAPGYTDAQLFDPETNTFTHLGYMNIGRMQHAAVELVSGDVLFAGAWYNPTGASVAEIFNSETNAFTNVGSLQTPRAGAVLFPTADGGAVLFGGWPSYGGAVIDQVEYFDPVSQTFSVLQNELIVGEPGWQAYNTTEMRPLTEKQMFDGRYVFRAGFYGVEPDFALVAFDPDSKQFEKLELDASLYQGVIDGYYDMVLNTEGTMAYLLGLSTDAMPYMLYLVAVDLTTGHVYFPTTGWESPVGEFVMGTMSWSAVTNKILLMGISTSGTDYFNATNQTWILTPEYTAVGWQELAGLQDRLMLYPVPAQQVLNVAIQSAGNWNMEVYDSKGACLYREVLQINEPFVHRIDLNSWPAGTYIVQIQDGFRMQYAPFIVSK